MNESSTEHLNEVLKDFDTTMMVTRTTDGGTNARPMAIAELGSDAHAYFVTSGHSGKAAEIIATPAVTLIFQSSSRFVSLSGRATLVQDRQLVERLWKEAWKLWFPKGKSDPVIAMIRFDAEKGEYWDNAWAQGLKYLFRAAKAYVMGETPNSDAEQHGKIAL